MCAVCFLTGIQVVAESSMQKMSLELTVEATPSTSPNNASDVSELPETTATTFQSSEGLLANLQERQMQRQLDGEALSSASEI